MFTFVFASVLAHATVACLCVQNQEGSLEMFQQDVLAAAVGKGKWRKTATCKLAIVLKGVAQDRHV